MHAIEGIASEGGARLGIPDVQRRIGQRTALRDYADHHASVSVQRDDSRTTRDPA